MDNETLYRKHMKTIYGFFMAKTFNKHLSEDLTSEVFISAFNQFNLPDSETRILDKEKYLYGVAKLIWLKHLRNKYSNQVIFVENVDDFEQYALKSIDDTMSRSLINRAIPYIEKLPEKQRDVLLLRFRDGYSLKEICERTNSSMNYVKTTQKRGIASLKKLVEGENI